MQKSSIWKGRYLTVIIAAAMLSSATGVRGTCLSLFIVPICTDLNISTATLLIYSSIMSFISIFSTPVWGRVIAKIGLMKSVLFSALVSTAALALWAVSTNVVMIYVAAGLLGIFGPPSTTLGASIAITMWFEEKRSTVMGYALTFISVSAVIISAILPGYISSAGWQAGFWWIVGLFAVMTIPFSFLLKSPAEHGMVPFGHVELTAEQKAVGAKAVELPGLTFKEALKSPVFYILFIALMLVALPTAFMVNAAAWGVASGFSASQAGLLISFCTFTGIFGVVLVGTINEKLKTKATTTIFLSLGIAGFVLGLFAKGNYIIAVLSMVLIAIGYSFQVGMPPVIAGTVFGAKEYSSIYSNIAIGVTVAGIIGTPGIALIYDLTQSYNSSLLVCAACWVLGFVLLLAALKRSPAYKVEAPAESAEG